MLTCDVEVTATVLLGSCCSYGTVCVKGAPSKNGQHSVSFTLQRAAVSFSCGDEVMKDFFQNITVVTIMCYLSLKLDLSQRHGDTL